MARKSVRVDDPRGANSRLAKDLDSVRRFRNVFDALVEESGLVAVWKPHEPLTTQDVVVGSIVTTVKASANAAAIGIVGGTAINRRDEGVIIGVAAGVVVGLATWINAYKKGWRVGQVRRMRR